jgi:hypothetical protein
MSSDSFGTQSKIASQLEVIFNINTRAGDNIKSVSCDSKYSDSAVRTDTFSRNLVLRYRHPWLPPQRRVFLDKLVVAQVHKTFMAFYGNRGFITVFTKASPDV